MRKFLKIIFLLGILFWITFFFNGLFRMYAFNGFGNQFEFVCIDARDYKIVEEANSILFFTYTYMVNGKNYTSEERIASDVFVNGKLLSQSTIKICYNSTFPKVSYIEQANISTGREKVNIIISMIFILLISVMYIYAKGEFWIERYNRFFRKLAD